MKVLFFSVISFVFGYFVCHIRQKIINICLWEKMIYEEELEKQEED